MVSRAFMTGKFDPTLLDILIVLFLKWIALFISSIAINMGQPNPYELTSSWVGKKTKNC